jgi:hypothetical protein
MGFWSEESAQVSAELIIIIAAVLAVALIVVTQMLNTARTGAEKMGSASDRIWSDVGGISNATKKL